MLKSSGSALKMLVYCLLVVGLLAACSQPKSGSGGAENGGTANEQAGSGQKTSTNGAASDKKEPVTLKIMFQKGEGDGPDPLYEWMSENVKLFEERNPHIKFDVIANASADNYLTVITTKMAANDLPDIFQGWTLERMRPFADSGRIYDLSEELKSHPDWVENLSGDGIKATTFNGGVYGIPLEMAVETTFYNKKVFADHGLEVPKTYDEFLHIVDVLSASGITPVTVPNKEPWVGSILYQTIFERLAGLELYEKVIINGEGSWTEEPFIEAGRYIRDLTERGAFDKNMNSMTTQEAVIKLAEGGAGMYLQGSWSIPGMIERMGDNLGYFPFPEIEGGKGSAKSWIVLPNSALSISNSSKHKAEAVEFLKFVFSQERQLELAKKGYLTFYKTKTQEGDIPKLNQEVLNGLNEATGTMYPWDVPLGVAMGKEINNATQSIYTGIDPEVAFERLQQAADSQQ